MKTEDSAQKKKKKKKRMKTVCGLWIYVYDKKPLQVVQKKKIQISVSEIWQTEKA